MQLNMQDIYNICMELKAKGLKLKDIPIYLGNDDELNGIHCAWYNTIIDSNDTDEDTQYLLDMINEDYGNNELKGIGVLIS